jgi:hypothetical protein
MRTKRDIKAELATIKAEALTAPAEQHPEIIAKIQALTAELATAPAARPTRQANGLSKRNLREARREIEASIFAACGGTLVEIPAHVEIHRGEIVKYSASSYWAPPKDRAAKAAALTQVEAEMAAFIASGGR